MTKYEFLAAMQEELSSLRVPERMEHCAFYEELINDMMEDGYTEEDATARLGDPVELAKSILQEDAPTGEAPPASRNWRDILQDFLQGKSFSFRWNPGSRDRFETQVPAEGIHALEIRCVSGDVEVTAEDRETILLAEERDPGDSPMVVETHGGRLSVSLPPEIMKLGGDKDLTVILPTALAKHLTECSITSVSGEVRVEEVRTESLRIQTQSGDVAVSDVDTASAEIRTTSGDLNYSGSAEDLTLQSVSGDVDFSGAVGTVRFTTVSGDVDLSCDRCPSRLQGASTSGDLDICLPSNSVCAVRFHSVSGDLTLQGVRTDGACPADFSVKTVSGDVNIHT